TIERAGSSSPARSSLSIAGDAGRRRAAARTGSGQRKLEPEAAAASGLALDAHPTVHPLHGTLHHRQPDPGPGELLAPVELREHAENDVEVLGRDADPVV